MPIKNAIHSQQVYDPTDESIMAEQDLCMERLYPHHPGKAGEEGLSPKSMKNILRAVHDSSSSPIRRKG